MYKNERCVRSGMPGGGRRGALIRRRGALWAQRVFERLFVRRGVERLYGVAGGHILFQALVAGVRLGLFERLRAAPGSTLPELAESLGCAQKPLRIVLLPLVATRLLAKRGERYFNTRLAGRTLAGEGGGRMLEIIKWQHFINYRAMYYLTESVQRERNEGLQVFPGDEPTLYERLAHQPELEGIFQSAMQEISRMSNRLLVDSVDFGQFSHVMDVGGGNGANLMAILEAHSRLRGTLFDFPTVCALAERRFAEAGLSARLGVHPGHCFEDPFPEGPDCICFCHFLTIWSEAKNRQLIAKAHAALPPGGAVVVFNMMQNNAGDGPLTSAIGSPYFLALATGEGMLYTWREYEEWMRGAGFRRVLTQRLVRDHGVVIGLK